MKYDEYLLSLIVLIRILVAYTYKTAHLANSLQRFVRLW